MRECATCLISRVCNSLTHTQLSYKKHLPSTLVRVGSNGLIRNGSLRAHISRSTPTAGGGGGKGGGGQEMVWPERPKFGAGNERSPEQWCALYGGSQMVRCRLGDAGASLGESTDRGVWGWRRSYPMPTMVGAGLWTLPDDRSPFIQRTAQEFQKAAKAQSTTASPRQ